ncbi:ribonuclease T2 family protein [Rhodospirillum sp. A1_3_36]|uniref:ribonuclease T2 family protein n=1 Tax=Rhodospirillum sp. A1_3_36 TaxID=3391666 RepID=UPI0039A59BA7
MRRALLLLVLTLPLHAMAAGTRQAESTDNLLALSWQPTFCETKPETRECRGLNRGGHPEASQRLSLHGLWPQPRDRVYCGVSAKDIKRDKAGDWKHLPVPPLSTETQARLDAAMPGVASQLDRHEWIKHGTCYNAKGGAEEYIQDALALTDAVNGSLVGTFLSESLGRSVSTDAIRKRFDQAFGPDTGARVQVTCLRDGDRTLIREIKLSLRGLITPGADLGDLLRSARPQKSTCKAGILDPTGLQ